MNMFKFLDKSKDLVWTQSRIMRFIDFQKENSSEEKWQLELIAITIRQSSICDMNDFHLAWKKITKGLPKPRYASNDRIPAKEEIAKLVEYPDRRIKPIIYTIISSGIRLGIWDFIKWKHIVLIMTIRIRSWQRRNSLCRRIRRILFIHHF